MKLLMNHLALCDQAVHPDTEVQTSPFGEFLKALSGGIPLEGECNSGSLGLWCRSQVEAFKALTAGGPAGINAQGAVPEDLERKAQPKNQPKGQAKVRKPQCSHLGADEKFKTDQAAMEHLTCCLGLKEQAAKGILAAARQKRKEADAQRAA
jgi:hypothetical protein